MKRLNPDNAKYEGSDPDIALLERIKELNFSEPSPLDSPALKGLMNWGVNFYTRKLEDPNPSKDNVWKTFVEKMHDPLGILVIHKTGVTFNTKDHRLMGGSAPTSGAVVERIVKPGFKVSAGSTGARYGKSGYVIEPAHVVTGRVSNSGGDR